jgi:hypothetical protein
LLVKLRWLSSEDSYFVERFYRGGIHITVS